MGHPLAALSLDVRAEHFQIGFETAPLQGLGQLARVQCVLKAIRRRQPVCRLGDSVNNRPAEP